MNYAARTDIGLAKAKTGGINEDSVSATVFEEWHRESGQQGVGVFVVADGVGAYDNSDYASYIATTTIPEELTLRAIELAKQENSVQEKIAIDIESEKYPSDDEIEDWISEAIGAAHDQIIDNIGLEKGATTVVVGLYAHGHLHLGWVGDSKAAILNCSRGEIEYPTRDHSLVQHYVEEGSIRPEVARVHDERSTIVRAVGGSDAEVETNTVPIYGDDIVLIASDGLFDAYDRAGQLYRKYVRADSEEQEEAAIENILEAVVTDDEISEAITRPTTLEGSAEALISLAQKKGGDDNVSALLFSDSNQPAITTVEDAAFRTHEAHRDESMHDLETDSTIVKK